MLHDELSPVIAAVFLSICFHSQPYPHSGEGHLEASRAARLSATLMQWELPHLWFPAGSRRLLLSAYVCVRWASRLVWFQGMPWINMLFLLLFLHLSVIPLVHLSPQHWIQKRAGHLDWVTHPSQNSRQSPGWETASAALGAFPLCCCSPSRLTSPLCTSLFLHTPWGGSTYMS